VLRGISISIEFMWKSVSAVWITSAQLTEGFLGGSTEGKTRGGKVLSGETKDHGKGKGPGGTGESEASGRRSDTERHREA